MSDLRTLFPDSRFNIPVTMSNPYTQLYVYQTNINTVNNGGRCCLWTVPSGATWARFEAWGGGGGGAGTCCCQNQNSSGGAGSYARKTISVVPGQQYTICAAGSTCHSAICTGCIGIPSYACGNNSNSGITYPLCLCASGGGSGISTCISYGGCCSCVAQTCGSACGYDLFICGVQSGSMNATCGYDSWGYVSEPTYIGSGVKITRDFCQNLNGCDMVGASWPTFPGGGGATGSTSSTNCSCGQQGAGGLVVITYK